MAPTELTLDEFKGLKGFEVGVSEWIEVDQLRINEFSKATLDEQFIHVDAERARASAFGGTIAHGFLTLSLLSGMRVAAVPGLSGSRMTINYGVNSVRFIAPVNSGARVRGRFVLRDVVERSANQIMFTFGVTIEIEERPKPALVAEWLALHVM